MPTKKFSSVFTTLCMYFTLSAYFSSNVSAQTIRTWSTDDYWGEYSINEVEIPEGTNFAVGGLGTRHFGSMDNTGTFTVDVPNLPTVTIEKVIVYFGGRDRHSRNLLNHDCYSVVGDNILQPAYDSVYLNGVLIHGQMGACKVSYRLLERTLAADITNLGIVNKGFNTITVSFADPVDGKYDGIGIVVIYNDTESPDTILKLFDGNYFPYDMSEREYSVEVNLRPNLNDSVADGFTMVANTERGRASYIDFSTTGNNRWIQDPMGSYDGFEFDVISTIQQTSDPLEPIMPTLVIPAGNTDVTMTIGSGTHEEYLGTVGWRSSFYILASGFRIENAVEDDETIPTITNRSVFLTR